MKYKIVIGYILIESDVQNFIQDSIQGSLEAGFKLHGNIFPLGIDGLFAQAMIYDDD